MNAGKIWWSQIGSSLTFLDSIAECMHERKSAVLEVPENLPWREEFFEEIAVRRNSFSSDRMMKRLEWNPTEEPGMSVLKTLCQKSVILEYWPTQSPAAFLASRKDLLLHSCEIWITGIRTSDELERWKSFAVEYRNAMKDSSPCASFYLEFPIRKGADPSGAPVEREDQPRRLLYTVEKCDCRVFALESLSAMQRWDVSQIAPNKNEYRAELALCISDGDPELCQALLEEGTELLLNLADTSRHAMNAVRPALSELSDQEIFSSVWKVQLILLMPKLENFRMQVIREYESQLKTCLPITNSNGDSVTEVCDLEIANLRYLGEHGQIKYSTDVWNKLNICRGVRNLLAHNKIVTYSDVLFCMNL